MDTYDKMLDQAVVITKLAGNDIFSVIAEMIDAMVAHGLLDEAHRDEAKQAVVRREMSASTVMTDEIALPHGRTDVVDKLVCAVGIHSAGFLSDSPDGAPTRIVILMLVPPASGAGYMTFLANLSMTLMDADKRGKVIEATTSEGVIAALKN